MLAVAAVLMVAQSTLALIPYMDRLHGGPTKPVLGAIGLVLQLFFCASIAMVVQYLVLWMLGIYCVRHHVRARTYWLSSLATIPVIVLITGLGGLGYWNSVRNEYPLESLAQRLDYERTRAVQQEVLAKPLAIKHASLASERSDSSLDDLYRSSEEHSGAEFRASRLQQLHTAHVEQFINSPGFGIGRGMMLYLRPLRYREPRGPIQQPEIVPQDDATPEAGPRPTQPVPAEQLLALLDSALVGFANQTGYGWVQDREHVAGFESHAFRQWPTRLQERGELQLELRRVELVSLLKHDQPMVYDSANLPNMTELKTAPVRELDRFERRALPLLQNAGQDLVSESHGNQIRLLGSIRAAQQCLNCHSVSQGTLLGAFSYRLQDGPISQTKPQEDAPETF